MGNRISKKAGQQEIVRHRHSFFENQDALPSIFSSESEPLLKIDKESGYIHLMRKGIHAFIVIESVSATPKGLVRIMTHAGFRPAENVKTVQKFLCDGQVDVIDWSFPEDDPLPDRTVEIKKYFNGVEKHPSWHVPKAVADGLVKIISESKDNVDKIAYSLPGGSSTALAKTLKSGIEDNHNCGSWAVEMLEELRKKFPDAGVRGIDNWATKLPIAIPHIIVWRSFKNNNEQ